MICPRCKDPKATKLFTLILDQNPSEDNSNVQSYRLCHACWYDFGRFMRNPTITHQATPTEKVNGYYDT